MKVRRQKRKTPDAEMNVVPYIDVMLVLLVIFMITAPILTQGITVHLPQAASSETLDTSEKEPIIVSVNSIGEYFLNIDKNPDNPMNPHELVIRVAAEIALANENHQKLHVLVKGDSGVPYGKVVVAMNLLKEAGAEEVGLLTDPSDSEGA